MNCCEMEVLKAQENVPSGKRSGKLGNVSSNLKPERPVLPLISDVFIARKMKRSLSSFFAVLISVVFPSSDHLSLRTATPR